MKKLWLIGLFAALLAGCSSPAPEVIVVTSTSEPTVEVPIPTAEATQVIEPDLEVIGQEWVNLGEGNLLKTEWQAEIRVANFGEGSATKIRVFVDCTNVSANPRRTETRDAFLDPVTLASGEDGVATVTFPKLFRCSPSGVELRYE